MNQKGHTLFELIVAIAGILGIAFIFGSVSYLAYLVILALQKYIGG